VAGIGFTMSLFIGELAFANDPALLDVAKVAILAASVLAASTGWSILRTSKTQSRRLRAAAISTHRTSLLAQEAGNGRASRRPAAVSTQRS
jgi:hypothetical protein